MSVRKRFKKNKKAFYEVQVYVRGVRLAYRCFGTCSEAWIWHDQEKQRLEADPSSLKQKRRTITFLDILKQYQKEKFPLFAISTRQGIEGRIFYLSESPLASVKIVKLNAEHIDLWLDWLKEHPRVDHNKRKDFNQELNILSNILNWYHHFIDPSFVVPIVKRHRAKCFYKHNLPRRPDYFMRPKDVRRWIRWLKSRKFTHSVYWRLAVFMILTGVRVGEACGLKWDAVDLKQRMVNIFRIVGWDKKSRKPYLEERTKTKESIRTLILSKDVVNMLTEMRRNNPDAEFVFHQDGNILNYTSIRDAFTRGFEALKLPWRGTHICRHTYATMALYATKDLASVQANLGHTTQQTTERYAKVVKMISSNTAEKTAKVFKLFG